jgi:hypothetical protein
VGFLRTLVVAVIGVLRGRPLRKSSTVPVASTFTSAAGSSICQPSFMIWS